MLQELPKKEKDYSNPTRAQMFWRTVGECARRSVTPMLMYLFMSMIAVVTQIIGDEKLLWLRILLGVVCILCGAAYNAHLCYHYGKKHYEVFMTGEVHRRNQAFGIPSGGDYRAHCEYRPWKGFVIGFFAGSIGLIFGIISAFTDGANFAYLLLAGWAFLPVAWAQQIKRLTYGEGVTVNGAWSLFMLLLPILVSGIFYIVGGMKRKREKEAADARNEALERVKEEQRQARMQREQTEEQRRKTAMSKKKK